MGSAYGRYTAQRARNAKWRKNNLSLGGIIGFIIILLIILAIIYYIIIGIAIILGIYIIYRLCKYVISKIKKSGFNILKNLKGIFLKSLLISLLFFSLWWLIAIILSFILLILIVIIGINLDKINTNLILDLMVLSPYRYWYITFLFIFISCFIYTYLNYVYELQKNKGHNKEKIIIEIPIKKKTKEIKDIPIIKSPTKIKKEPISYKKPKEISKKEIKKFFDKLKLIKERSFNDFIKEGVYLSNQNFDLFNSFINNTKGYLDITTNRIDGKLISKILWSLRNKDIKIRLITRNVKNKGYLKELQNYCSKLEISYKKRNFMHAKIMIKDYNKMIVGSSNISNASMSESGFFYDVNLISEDKIAIKSAQEVFDSIWNNKDKTQKYENNPFLYSREGEQFLPKCLKKYFENEDEEIVLLMSSGLIDRQILNKITSWNNKIDIKIVIGDKWPKENEFSEDKIESINEIIKRYNVGYDNIKIISKKEDIHAKVYLFKKQKIAVISSQNLTIGSWFKKLFEAGYLVEDKKQFEYIYNEINNLKDGGLESFLENLVRTEKPESSFSGTKKEKSIKTPWSLAEPDNEEEISKKISKFYYKIPRKTIKKTEEIDKEYIGRREESKPIIKNLFLKDIDKKYLWKASKTRLSKLSKGVQTGRQSNRSEQRYYESQLKRLEEKLLFTIDAKEREKTMESIEWYKKKLKELNKN